MRRNAISTGRAAVYVASALWALGSTSALSTSALAEPAEPFTWSQVERVVAIADVHGQYGELVSLLQGTGLIAARDERVVWSGGTSHLVLLGDLIDRGPADRAVLDLARRLQLEAPEDGGRVHVLLGNHEVMNLVGNFQYVTRGGFAAFAADETEAERQRERSAFRLSRASRGMGRRELAEAFAERYPPGYFARRRAFGPGGDYGDWLLEQPTAVKIDGRVFVHGGINREVASLGIEEINRRVQTSLRSFRVQAERLAPEADWPAAHIDLRRAAKRVTQFDSKAPNSAVKAGKAILALEDGLPFALDGPVWYRGSALENERIEERRLETSLDRLDATAFVVGHTPTGSGHVTSRFNERLHRIDVGMGYGRPGRALIIETGRVKAFDAASGSVASIESEPPSGEGWPLGEEELTDEALEYFLTHAKITSNEPADLGLPLRLLELRAEGLRLRALFGNGQETLEDAAAAGRQTPRRYQNTIAAYRLDRLLGLGSVPVTVPRRVKGQRGLVQIWLQGAWDQELLEEYVAWQLLEGLETEIADAMAFSALIGVVERVPAGRMFLPESRRIVLADNSVAFPLDDRVDPYLPEGCGPVSAAFLTSLRSLERDELAAVFEGLVTDAAIDALLARRDALLERCQTVAPEWTTTAIRERLTGLGN